MAAPTLADLNALTPDARALLLDVGQFTLDIVGIFEPTPFADLTSGVIALCRTDFASAAISAIAIIPYAGDIAKFGKIPHYIATVERAIQLARTNAAFAALLRPLLARLLSALDAFPLDRIGQSGRVALGRIRALIDDFLGPGRALTRVERLTEDLLMRVFGSTKNVGVLPRRNVRTIVEFFDKHGVKGRDPVEWAQLIKCIDLHAVEPVTSPGSSPVMSCCNTSTRRGRRTSRSASGWCAARGASDTATWACPMRGGGHNDFVSPSQSTC